MTTPFTKAAVLEILRTPAASDTFLDMIRRVEALEGCGVKERKTFPILKGEGASIDYQLVADHAEQARANHYQSVGRLAERGGLSWCELYAVLHNRKWEKMADNDAMITCRALEARYLAALEPVAQPETPTPGQLDPEQLARRFHDIYEQLAPNFGYETRPETRTFDPESPNGKLMIAVCGALQPTPGQFTTMCLAIEDAIAEVAKLRNPEQHGYVKVIDVEKLLCDKLGIQWSATGISIASMIDRLAAENQRLRDRERVLVGALINRDGGSHDEDCKARRYGNSDRLCNCGHDEVVAALATDASAKAGGE